MSEMKIPDSLRYLFIGGPWHMRIESNRGMDVRVPVPIEIYNMTRWGTDTLHHTEIQIYTYTPQKFVVGSRRYFIMISYDVYRAAELNMSLTRMIIDALMDSDTPTWKQAYEVADGTKI